MVRGLTLKVIFGILSLLSLALGYPLSVYAETATEAVFSLPKSNFRSLGLAAKGETQRQSAESFTVPLPGFKSQAKLFVVPGKSTEISFPIFGADGKTNSEFKAVVHSVSDYSSLLGVITETDVGTYGTVLNQSEAEPTYWQFSPSVAGSTNALRQHAINRVLPKDLMKDERCGADAHDVSGLRSEVKDLVLSSGSMSRNAQALSNDSWREMQVVFVSSGDFTAGRSSQVVAAQVTSMVAGVNFFLEPLKLVVQIAGLELHAVGSSDPYEAATASGDAYAMLDAVEQRWQTRFDPEHDAVALLAKRSFKSLYGLASTSTTCIAPHISNLFATQGGDSPSAELSLSATVAHELGHLLGMNHDNNLYSDGPSLMWSSFVLKPGGFSALSVNQYLEHAGSGRPGGACFSPTVAPPPGTYPGSDSPDGSGGDGGLVFDGGSSQSAKIKEGQTYSKQFTIVGKSSGLFFSALNLPAGASFNSTTGLFTYTPGFDVANSKTKTKSLKITIVAQSPDSSGESVLRLAVQDVNRAPELAISGDSSITVEEGESVRFSVSAKELDRYDSVKLSLDKKVIGKLKGRYSLKQSASRISFSWKTVLRSAGKYNFNFSATDKAGKKSRKSITVTVKPRNLAPTIVVPTISSGLGSGVVEFDVTAKDPEGKKIGLSIFGLPAGSLVQHRAEGLHIQLPTAASAATLSLSVSASDGVKSSSLTFPVQQNGNTGLGTSTGVSWPGMFRAVAAANSANQKIDFYNIAKGEWRSFGCDGSLKSETQFGGLLGDLPVNYKVHGESRPAIYRVISGQGYWLVNGATGMSSTPWGLAQDIPVGGDFDGDGITDFAVYRIRDGSWHIKFSSMPAQSLNDGIPSSERIGTVYPLAADVDGDFRDDRVLFYRQKDGNAVFAVWLATGERYSFVLGALNLLAVAQPLVGDIDGDSRADLLVRSGGGSITSFGSATGLQQKSALAASGAAIAIADCGGDAKAELVALEPLFGVLSVGSLGQSMTTFPKADLAGDFVSVHSANLRRAYKLQRATSGDTDGDGRSNLAVWRENNIATGGQWFERDILGQASVHEPLSIGYGSALAEDFNGDGEKELTYFSNGVWASQSSANKSVQLWGQAGDRPVPGDYNGDGIGDYAIYRPSTQVWWIYLNGPAAGKIIKVKWGDPGDQPVPADYDGDGATDLAVWRLSQEVDEDQVTGKWFINYATGLATVQTFGGASDVPVPGDYTGDGRANLALWRPSATTWFIVRGQKVISQNWGLLGDTPINADYDGDGRRDLAIWRPETGGWYFLHLDPFGNRTSTAQFGLSTDIPLGSEKPPFLF